MSKSKTKPRADSASATFEVGRGKPPRHTRFKPGQSGNPGGRRKGSSNLKTVLEAVMSSNIEITENGRKRQVPIVEALIKRQVQEGLRGQLRAIENLLDRYDRHADVETAPDEAMADEDQAILARMIGSYASDRTTRGSSAPSEDVSSVLEVVRQNVVASGGSTDQEADDD